MENPDFAPKVLRKPDHKFVGYERFLVFSNWSILRFNDKVEKQESRFRSSQTWRLLFAVVLFSACRKRGKCGMWLVNMVEIPFAKIGFVVSKLSNLNAPGSYTPWTPSLLGSTVACPFLWMQEMVNAACGWLIKWKFILKK